MKAFYSVAILFFVAVFLSVLIGCFYGYFYPMKYVTEIKAIADECEVSPSLIASVANVESGYNPNCVSNKGAIGIMQLMPSTAKWMCGRIGIEYSEERLVEPEYNLRIGGYYLAYLLSYFNDEENALCAYNAGLGNVRAWLADKKYSSDGKVLDDIPFEETRNYIVKINKNLRHYKNKYK